MVDNSSTSQSECRGTLNSQPVAFTYIMTNKRNGTLYVGVTNDIVKRSTEHRFKIIEGFTSRYNLDKLVYFEEYASMHEALKREKQLKKYPRQFKINLIEKLNSTWNDLYNQVVEEFKSQDPRDPLCGLEE